VVRLKRVGGWDTFRELRVLGGEGIGSESGVGDEKSKNEVTIFRDDVVDWCKNEANLCAARRRKKRMNRSERSYDSWD